jgi:hypothetical protein
VPLQDDGDDEEEAAATEGEEDEEGFVVGDGYLSDDEGMRDADEDAAAGELKMLWVINRYGSCIVHTPAAL